MSDIYKLQYNNMTLTFPGWNGAVSYEAAPAFKTLTLCASEGGTITATSITGLPGDTVTLSTAYNTYWRFSGYAKAGDGSISNNTYTFGEDDVQTVSAFYKKNAFTATGNFAWGTWKQPGNYGHQNNGTATFNSQLKAFTGDRPATWPTINAAWNVSNASAYGFKANTVISVKNTGNLRIYLTAAIQLNNSTKVTASAGGRNTNTYTANCNLSYNSTQGLARMSAHMSGQTGGYGSYGTATLPTNAWTATGYAP